MKKKDGKNMGDILGEQLRYLFESDPTRVWNLREIADILGYRGSRAKVLASRLASLAEDGEIMARGDGRFAKASGHSAGEIEGKLEIARSGAGFVTDAAHGRVLRIPAEGIRGAFPGDIVRVRPVKVGGDGESGRIVAIVARNEKLICATISIVGGDVYAIPLNPSYTSDIALDSAGEAADGDRVVIRIKSRDGANPRGEVVDIIGPASNPSLDTEAICREYELPGNFPGEAMAEAEAIESIPDDAESRLDLRKRFILTIDPAESRDFDDAISFRILPDGNRELGIHIADVASYVRPGSALDREAFRRGNSVYLADKVIPMLPEALSNGICSLRPKVDRRAFSVFIAYDSAGRPVARSFAKSIIRSGIRLNYAQALAIIEGRRPEGIARLPSAAKELLAGASELALQLRAIRMRNGALDLDLPECRLQIDASGRMTGFTLETYDVSHQMIEECMVAANEAVAAELSLHGHRIVSRLHEPPDPAKIADLSVSLKAIGFAPGDISNPANLSRFIASIRNHPLRAQAHTLILRSMKRALYSAEGHGHFGLAKARYSHFTSPIRRYTDLVLHRQLADYIARRRQSVPATFLASVAARCTETELRADEAERTLLEIKKFRFLQEQIEHGDPVSYDATISKVTSFGLFVDLPALVVGGLVHIATISNKFVRFDRFGGALVAGNARYAVGQSVKVHIARVDFAARRLDFALDHTGDRPEPRSGHKGKTRAKAPAKRANTRRKR